MDPLFPLPPPSSPVPPPPAGTAASAAAALAAGIAAEAEAVLARTVAEVVVATGKAVTVPATLLAPPPAAAADGDAAASAAAAAIVAGLPPGTRAALRLIAVTPPPDGAGGATAEIALASSGDSPISGGITASTAALVPSDESGGEPVTVGIVIAPPSDADNGSGAPSATATVIASPLGSWALARKLALPADTLVRFALLLPPPDTGRSVEPAGDVGTMGDGTPLAATLLALPNADAPKDGGAAPPVALWPGMRGMLRLLAVTPPGGGAEMPLSPTAAAPPSPAGVEIASYGTVAAAPATGTAASAAAGTVIASPLGTWALARPLALSPDTLVRFVLLLPAAARPAEAPATPAASLLAALVRTALALLDMPAAATESADTAALPVEIRRAFASPRSAAQLAAALTLGAADIVATRAAEDRPDENGTAIELPSPIGALARIAAAGGRNDLAAALAKAALPWPAAIPPDGLAGSRATIAAPATWTEIALPVLDDGGGGCGSRAAPVATPGGTPMPPVMLLLEDYPRPSGERGADEDGADGDEGNGERSGRRFAVTLELSRLGPVQLDGAVRRAEPGGAGQRHHLALTVRTGVALPPALRSGLAETFAAALDAAGFTGALAFAPLRRGTAGGGTARRPVDLRT
jgi:hypothetical protein